MGKNELLKKFFGVLTRLNGSVDLKNPCKELIYLEDWSTFHSEVTIGKNYSQQKRMSTRSMLDKEYKAKKIVFGIVVAVFFTCSFCIDLFLHPEFHFSI
jgi:hypothetical protein